MEDPVTSPHSCRWCKDIVVDLTQLDANLLKDGRIEWEGRPWDLRKTQCAMTAIDAKQCADSGCALMSYLFRSHTWNVKSESNLTISATLSGGFCEMNFAWPLDSGEFEVYAAVSTPDVGENVAAKYLVPAPNLAPASIGGFQQARDWFLDCLNHHSACHLWTPKDRNDFMPTRMLWVRSGADESVTIVTSAELKEPQPYAALSYCWGGDQTCKTTSANLSEPKRFLKDLPLTIQHAIRTTREIGMQYLWIDSEIVTARVQLTVQSMCIIQDSDEDKAREIVQMQKIYSCAGIAIAATSASACTEGFLHNRKGSPTFDLKAAFANGEIGTFTIVPKEQKGYHEPLARRAWTFQQCSLAPRILSYGARQARFFCLQQNSTAGLSDGGTVPLRYREDAGFMHVTEGLSRVDKTRLKSKDIWPWLSYCEQYSRRGLTFSGDKLVAISAVAQYLAEQKLYGAYYAGLWQFNFLGQMLWAMSTKEIAARPKEYRAPSWSWASVDGRPSWDDVHLLEEKDFTCRVEQVSVTPVSKEAPLGAVASASVRVSGRSREAIWRRSANELLNVTDRRPIMSGDDLPRRDRYELYADTTDDFEGDEVHVELLEVVGSKSSSALMRGLGVGPEFTVLRMILLTRREDGSYSRVGSFKTRVKTRHKLSGLEKTTLTIV